MKYKRVLACSHAQEDAEKLGELAKQMPEDWSAVVIPAHGHPLALVPDNILPERAEDLTGEGIQFTTVQMFCMMISQLAHDEGWLERFLIDNVDELAEHGFHVEKKRLQ